MKSIVAVPRKQLLKRKVPQS